MGILIRYIETTVALGVPLKESRKSKIKKERNAAKIYENAIK